MERFNAFKCRFKKVQVTFVQLAIDFCTKVHFLDLDFIVKKILNEKIFFYVGSHSGQCQICLTFDRKLNKNAKPCQAEANKLVVERLPSQLQTICRLERALASRRIFFKKVTIMPKIQSCTLKGSICNIPISKVDINCVSHARPVDNNGLIIVRLKCEEE